ncbi:Crp/Fnr family transcriptional regulator [Brevundimonas sp. VNH65]|uniref:Crp/Fnr family transcriptional regulator n=1 Tax=Brevundimonas sp. VNH65 TaxID=3400917 RepID=UPI003C03C740
MNAVVEKLRRRDIISDEEMAALDGILEPPRRAAAGTDIVPEKAITTQSTLLLSGFSGRYSTLADGGRQITEINVAGDFVDLHSLLMKHMDHGVVALSDCVYAAAPHARLIELTERYPHLTRLLWLDTIIDAAVHRQWLVAMGRRSGLAHLAHLLCEMFLRLQVIGHVRGMAFELPLTQSVLGDVLGLSTVHVNRLISQLRAESLVSWSQFQVQILDWDRLAAVAEFDPAYLRLHSAPV